MPEVTAIVFVVDDDISVRESLELLIKSAGWQPETFASAQDFLSRPPVSHPCCLVLDVTLPGLNGLELQQQLAERTDMPIIFITGYGDIPMSVRAMKAGAVEFLTKPFKDDVRLNAIRGALDRSRAAGRQDSEVRELKNCSIWHSRRGAGGTAAIAARLRPSRRRNACGDWATTPLDLASHHHWSGHQRSGDRATQNLRSA